MRTLSISYNYKGRIRAGGSSLPALRVGCGGGEGRDGWGIKDVGGVDGGREVGKFAGGGREKGGNMGGGEIGWRVPRALTL